MVRKKNIALVLSSGGARGLAHIGAIEELTSQGFVIRSVSGSSIGALIGGLYAMGNLDVYTQWVKTLDKQAVWGLMDFSLTSKGLLKGERVFDNMKTFIPDINIEDMGIPFTALASDIIRKKEVPFTSGSFYNAIRASIAIPTLFTPMEYGDSFLVDGGVLNPLPFEYVQRKPGDLLVGVNLNSFVEPVEEKIIQPLKKNNTRYQKITSDFSQLFDIFSRLNQSKNPRSLGYFSLIRSATSAMVSQIAALSIEKHKPDILIEIPKDAASTFDFYKAEELIAFGREKTRQAIEKQFNSLIVR